MTLLVCDFKLEGRKEMANGSLPELSMTRNASPNTVKNVPKARVIKPCINAYHLEILAGLFYLLTNWLAYLYGRIQSPRPDVMPDRREGITRAAGFEFARIDTQAS